MLKDILERIDARLEAVGLTESKAATLAGLNNSTIRDMRRAVKNGREDGGVNTTTLVALAPILKTTPEYLFTGKGEAELLPDSWSGKLAAVKKVFGPDRAERLRKQVDAIFDVELDNPPRQ